MNLGHQRSLWVRKTRATYIIQELTMVSAEEFRDDPTRPIWYERMEAPSRGLGYVSTPDTPGSPEGITRAQVPVLVSRMSFYMYPLLTIRTMISKEAHTISPFSRLPSSLQRDLSKIPNTIKT